MTRKDFIDFLANHSIPYKEYTECGLDFVYVYPRKDYEKGEIRPYIRVSHFDKERWYTRNCGICSYENPKVIMRQCLRLGA